MSELGVALAAGIVHGSGIGRADPLNDPSSWAATCLTLGNLLNADPENNFKTILDISIHIAQSSGLSQSTAWDMEGWQVHDHCPQYGPYLVEALQYAQNHAIYVGPQYTS
jgi:hypothetical protein